MALFDLLNDFGEGAFFRQEIDLYGSRFDLRSSGLFIPALKTWLVVLEWPRGSAFGAPLGWSLRGLVGEAGARSDWARRGRSVGGLERLGRSSRRSLRPRL